MPDSSDTSTETLAASGVAWLKKNDPDRAIADFTRAIRLDPKNAKAYRHRGIANGNKRELDKAISDLDQAILLAPNDAAAHYLRGRVWQMKGDRTRAIADYDRAVTLDPNHLKAFQARDAAVNDGVRQPVGHTDIDRISTASNSTLKSGEMKIAEVIRTAVGLVLMLIWFSVFKPNDLAALAATLFLCGFFSFTMKRYPKSFWVGVLVVALNLWGIAHPDPPRPALDYSSQIYTDRNAWICPLSVWLDNRVGHDAAAFDDATLSILHRSEKFEKLGCEEWQDGVPVDARQMPKPFERYVFVGSYPSLFFTLGIFLRN